ncbi:hypothetical protein [Pantoea sp. UBA4549]|uniref:hypothetical protein n=1 Tax=Pantoea sp. UBA4549 TaxID=1947033 RepID=UPI0025E0D02D|nr:hypothetical protein [Pantoea sp. UBA4549]
MPIERDFLKFAGALIAATKEEAATALPSRDGCKKSALLIGACRSDKLLAQFGSAGTHAFPGMKQRPDNLFQSGIRRKQATHMFLEHAPHTLRNHQAERLYQTADLVGQGLI